MATATNKPVIPVHEAQTVDTNDIHEKNTTQTTPGHNTIALAGDTLIPFVPSSKESIMKFIEISKLTSNDVLVDIGCGDGRILIAAAKMAKCKCIGIEISDNLIAKARQSAKDELDCDTSHLVEIIKCDFTSIQCTNILKQATVVFIYLLTYIMPLITEILMKSVRDGCRVITNTVDLGRLIANPIENIRMIDWSYPIFGSTLVWIENKIFITNFHPDIESICGIKIDKLEFCQLVEINDRNFEHVDSEYDFILAKRYLYGVVSNYYQFRKHSLKHKKHKLDMLLRYRYKHCLHGNGHEYDMYRDQLKWCDRFEAIKPNEIIHVRNKTSFDVSENKYIYKCDLKVYIFPVAETDFGWENANPKIFMSL